MSTNMDRGSLIEKLADKEHASWSRWMSYLFSKCTRTPEGSLAIPTDLEHRWKNQMETPYEDLSLQEKESDRKEVYNILPDIDMYVTHAAVPEHPLLVVGIRSLRDSSSLRGNPPVHWRYQIIVESEDGELITCMPQVNWLHDASLQRDVMCGLLTMLGLRVRVLTGIQPEE